MPDVELIATKDFSYATRRLRAGDRFTVPAPMARVLVGIGKAEQQRTPGKVAPPPPELTTRAATATPQKPEAPRPVAAASTASTRTGTKRRTTRKSTAKKG